MIYSTGPHPDPKLIEDRPEGVSMEAAVGAWLAGYYDSRHGRDYHVFPPDSAELQHLYSDGFERGERDDLHMQRINGRVPEEHNVIVEGGHVPEDLRELVLRDVPALAAEVRHLRALLGWNA